MSQEVVIRVDSIEGAQFALSRASAAISKGIEAGPIEVVLRRPGKSRLQEEKYHAMIGDIHRQCFRGYSFDGVKAVLVNQFAREMEEAGTPLSKPGEKVWDWDMQEAVYVRPSTTKFRKAEAAAFVEFLYSVGTGYEVRWSEPALKAYESFKEAA